MIQLRVMKWHQTFRNRIALTPQCLDLIINSVVWYHDDRFQASECRPVIWTTGTCTAWWMALGLFVSISNNVLLLDRLFLG